MFASSMKTEKTSPMVLKYGSRVCSATSGPALNVLTAPQAQAPSQLILL